MYFHFIFSFNFCVIQGGSLSWKVTNLFGIKFDDMLIVLFKIFTCWGTFLKEDKNFQLTWFIALVIAFTSAFLKSQTKRSYGGGHTILRLSLQYVI